MTAVAVALLAALAFAAAGWGAGAVTERLTPSPRLRERVWSLAFALPLMAAIIPAVALFFPRPVFRTPPVLLAKLIESGSAPASVAQAPSDPLAQALNAALDHGPVALVGVVTAGAVLSLAGLALRHRALSAALKAARPLERGDLTQILATRAAALGVRVPVVALSDQVRTPVLVGQRRPSIVVPDSLAALPTDRLALICAHELAHLKHGDNLRLLAEDLVLALLWFSPVQRAVHQRLSAAREEARDALALAGAAPAERRRYAETLVEILRLGAGAGLKTAFIGTGRKGTALRLKAILKPGGEDSRGHRLAVGGLALLLLAGAGAGSLAVAAQVGPEQKTTSQITASSSSSGLTVTSDYLQTMPNRGLRWVGDPRIRFDKPGGEASFRFLIDGLPAPVGFRPEAIDPKSLAWIEGRSGETPMTLNFVRKGSEAAVRQAKYDRADAVDYQRFCASEDPGEYGFCAGMIFGAIGKAACLPDGMDIVATPDRVIPIIAAARPARGEPMKAFVIEAVKTAFPCPADESRTPA